MLSNNLLHEEKSKDVGTFTKALTLSIFLCCNAVKFSLQGTDMNIWQYRSNNTLPSIPLQGCIRKLVEELQRIFTHRLFPSYINTANIPTKTPESFYDVFNVLESLLNNDEFILCNLKQRSTTEVKVRQEQVTQSTLSFLESVPFDADNTMFTNWSHSMSFLEAIASQTNQEEAQEKKSSEADAYRKISKLVRRPLDQIQVAAAICSFKHLKATLQRFFGMVQAKRKAMDNGPRDNFENSQVMQDILHDIPNLLQDKQLVRNRTDYISQALLSNSVTDSIECSCCGIFFAQDPIPAVRCQQYIKTGKYCGISFRDFTQEYNRMNFNNEFGYHFDMGETLAFHVRTPFHADSCYKYTQSLDRICTVIARLMISIDLMNIIIQRCRTEAQGDATNLST